MSCSVHLWSGHFSVHMLCVNKVNPQNSGSKWLVHVSGKLAFLILLVQGMSSYRKDLSQQKPKCDLWVGGEREGIRFCIRSHSFQYNEHRVTARLWLEAFCQKKWRVSTFMPFLQQQMLWVCTDGWLGQHYSLWAEESAFSMKAKYNPEKEKNPQPYLNRACLQRVAHLDS